MYDLKYLYQKLLFADIMPIMSLHAIYPYLGQSSCHHSQSEQKFKFEIDENLWEMEGDICLRLPICKTSWPLQLDIKLQKKGPSRIFRISKFELCSLNDKHPMKKKKSDRVLINIHMLKNKEERFHSLGKYYDDPDSEYEVLIPDPKQIDLFDEYGKFTLELTVYLSSKEKEIRKQAAVIHERRRKDIMNYQETSNVKIISNEREFKCCLEMLNKVSTKLSEAGQSRSADILPLILYSSPPQTPPVQPGVGSSKR